MSDSKLPLIGLKADQFRHPLDLEATQSLRRLPGLDLMVRTFLGPLAEQFFYLDNIASSVRVSKQQLPHLHDQLLEVCRVLDLEPPQLYVRQHPLPNAYTFAMRGNQPFVVLHTALIELLTPEETQAVIAHEMGHLKCDHGVYLTLANLIALAAGQIPIVGGLIFQGLQEQLMQWMRCAELTCDRAALLATQDAKIAISVLMKLAGGSPTLAPQLNLDAFLQQARTYDTLSTGRLGQALKQAHTSQLTHPLPVLRAREIDRWASSPEYELLLKQHSIQYNKLSRLGGQTSAAALPSQIQNRPHQDTQPTGEWRNW